MTQDRFEELILSQLAKLDVKISDLDKKVDDKLDAIGKETAWIRGKLQARSAFLTDLKSRIAIGVAIAAVIFAWFK